MPDFPIVDSHVHFWNPTNLRYPWLDGNPTLNRPFLPADYRAACGPVTVGQIVFVECGGTNEQNQAEVDWVTGLVADEPRIAGIVARLDVENGERATPALETLSANPLVKGVRRLLQGEREPGYCLRPDFIAGVRLLPRYGLSFDICIRHHQLRDAIALVRACPEVAFILDHIAKPDIRTGTLDPWRAEMRELASYPNVVCKVSGLVTEADMENWTSADLKPYVEETIAAFGWNRVLYGSDWPVATLATVYPRWVETLDGLLSACSDSERRALYVENAVRVYRL